MPIARAIAEQHRKEIEKLAGQAKNKAEQVAKKHGVSADDVWDELGDDEPTDALISVFGGSEWDSFLQSLDDVEHGDFETEAKNLAGEEDEDEE